MSLHNGSSAGKKSENKCINNFSDINKFGINIVWAIILLRMDYVRNCWTWA